MRTSRLLEIEYDDIDGIYCLTEKTSGATYDFTNFDIARIGIGVVKKAQHYFKNKGVYIKQDLLVDKILKEIVKL